MAKRNVLILGLLLIISVFVLVSCRSKVIDENKYSAVYCDLTLAQDTLNMEEFKKEKISILKKYEITEKELKSTYDYYYQNPELWKPLFEKALDRMNKIKSNKPVK